MIRKIILAAASLAVLVGTSAPVSAQIEIGADVGMNSQYIWRGLNIANPQVSQPLVRHFFRFQVGGDDPDHLAAVVQDRIGQHTHQADPRAAIDQRLPS